METNSGRPRNEKRRSEKHRLQPLLTQTQHSRRVKRSVQRKIKRKLRKPPGPKTSWTPGLMQKSGRNRSSSIIFTPMRILSRFLVVLVVAVIVVAALVIPGFAQHDKGRLVLSGDLAYFFGVGKSPLNCTLNNRYKRGMPVGFRMTAINPETGKRDRSTQL